MQHGSGCVHSWVRTRTRVGGGTHGWTLECDHTGGGGHRCVCKGVADCTRARAHPRGRCSACARRGLRCPCTHGTPRHPSPPPSLLPAASTAQASAGGPSAPALCPAWGCAGVSRSVCVGGRSTDRAGAATAGAEGPRTGPTGQARPGAPRGGGVLGSFRFWGMSHLRLMWHCRGGVAKTHPGVQYICPTRGRAPASPRRAKPRGRKGCL